MPQFQGLHCICNVTSYLKQLRERGEHISIFFSFKTSIQKVKWHAYSDTGNEAEGGVCVLGGGGNVSRAVWKTVQACKERLDEMWLK